MLRAQRALVAVFWAPLLSLSVALRTAKPLQVADHIAGANAAASEPSQVANHVAGANTSSVGVVIPLALGSQPVDVRAHAICRVRGVGVEKVGVGDVAVTFTSATNERSLIFEKSGGVVQTTVKCSNTLNAWELSQCTSFGQWNRVDSAADCPPCPCHGVGGPLPQQFACLSEMAKSVTASCAVARRPNSRPYEVLIVGMGGGALATHISRDCGPSTHIDAIEFDQRVIDVSERYFGVEPSSSMAIQRADCLDAVKSRAAMGRLYDVVLVDCFERGGKTPERCRNEDFVSSLLQLVRPTGFVGHHLWHDDADHPQVAGEFESTIMLYNRHFGNTTIVKLATAVNDIVYAWPVRK